MRLIDADALIEELREKVAHFNYFKGLVQAQPTAYDVEKVAAELEKAESVKNFGSVNSKNLLIPLNDAVAIVRKGGVE